MTPMVSIIIPVYNCGKYIAKCLDSVLCQTFHDWEVIAVNDGSHDNSLEILLEYAKRDLRIVVIDQVNSGVVTARNNALKSAKGEYLTFLDADDCLTPDALALMVEALKRDSADVCVGGYSLEWEDSGRIVEINRPKRFDSAEGCFRYCLDNGEMFLAIKMFRTELFKRVVDIPSDIIIQEDTIGLVQYLEHARRATSVNKSIYIYLKRPDGVSSRTSSRHIESLIKVVEFLLSNKFAMTMPDVVFRSCAGTMLYCHKFSGSNEDYNKDVSQIWKSIPIKYRFNARLLHYRAKAKGVLKRIIRFKQ